MKNYFVTILLSFSFSIASCQDVVDWFPVPSVPQEIVISSISNASSSSFAPSGMVLKGQSFLVPSTTINSIAIFFSLTAGSPVFNVRLEIYSESGGDPGTLLYTSDNFFLSDGEDYNTPSTFTFTGATVTAGTYFFVTKYSSGIHNLNNQISFQSNGQNPYADGNRVYKIGSGGWVHMPTWDFRGTITHTP